MLVNKLTNERGMWYESFDENEEIPYEEFIYTVNKAEDTMRRRIHLKKDKKIIHKKEYITKTSLIPRSK